MTPSEAKRVMAACLSNSDSLWWFLLPTVAVDGLLWLAHERETAAAWTELHAAIRACPESDFTDPGEHVDSPTARNVMAAWRRFDRYARRVIASPFARFAPTFTVRLRLLLDSATPKGFTP